MNYEDELKKKNPLDFKREREGSFETENRGIYGKYRIEKTDGAPTDPGAVYFTLRIDTDPHARRAVLAYIASVNDENPELAQDLMRMVREFEPDECYLTNVLADFMWHFQREG